MRLAYEYCDKHNVPYKKVGKLIVARDDVEVERLHVLREKGMKNEVPDLELISSSKITELEPYVRGKEALLSPHTGIVDWGLVTRSFAESFKQKGGDHHLNFEVTGFEMSGDKVRIQSKDRGVLCRYALTCGGLQADRLSEMSGCGREPRIIPFRGEYLLLKPEKQYLVKRNIYPVPDPRFPFLGVHFTPRMDGSVWLGPNAVLAFKREGYKWTDIDFGDLWDAIKFRGFQKLAVKYVGFGAGEMMRSAYLSLQVKELQRFVPDLKVSDVTRGPAGVRAQAMDSGGEWRTGYCEVVIKCFRN
jgi:2-hydroxyglutarate dehydrogenase